MVPPNLCFVMELCQDSLYHLLHVDRVNYSESDCIRIALDVASAMEYLHSLKPVIIHRDLKSLNVLIAFNGAAKICDFGLVKNVNTQAGTPAYMAPELFQNKSYNKSVDVYAFAILFWEILSGEVPFYMQEIMDIRQKVMGGSRPRIPATISPRCSRLIQRAWEQNGRERPDFTEIVDELLDISDSLPDSKHTEDVGGVDALDSLLHK